MGPPIILQKALKSFFASTYNWRKLYLRYCASFQLKKLFFNMIG